MVILNFTAPDLFALPQTLAATEIKQASEDDEIWEEMVAQLYNSNRPSIPATLSNKEF